MRKFKYQVEYFNDNLQRDVIRVYESRPLALNHARNMSRSHSVAAVIATLERKSDGACIDCGHKSFANGLVMETVGEGFEKERK